MVAVFFVGTLLMAPAAITLLGYVAQDGAIQSILYPNPEILHGAPWIFWRNIAVAACESPVSNFVIPLLATLAGGVVITFYERSRCVDANPDVVNA